MAHQGAKDLVVFGQVLLHQRGHDAARIRNGNRELHATTEPESATHPLVFDKPGPWVRTTTFMRNRRSSNRLAGLNSFSRSRVDVVRTDMGNKSKNEPTPTGEGSPGSSKKADPSFWSTTVSR